MNVASKPQFANVERTAGLGTSVQVLSGPGQLRTLRCYNNSGSTVYLQIHDTPAAAAESEAPYAPPIPIVAGGYYESDAAIDMPTGCYVCASSTAATKTIVVSNDVFILATKN